MKTETIAVLGAVGLLGFAVYYSSAAKTEELKEIMATKQLAGFGMKIPEVIPIQIPQVFERIRELQITQQPEMPKIDWVGYFENLYTQMQENIQKTTEKIRATTTEEIDWLSIIKRAAESQTKGQNDYFGSGFVRFVKELGKAISEAGQEIILTPYRAGQTVGRETQIGLKLQDITQRIGDMFYNQVVRPTVEFRKSIAKDISTTPTTPTTPLKTIKTERRYLAEAPEWHYPAERKRIMPIQKTRKAVKTIVEKYPQGISIAPEYIPEGYVGISTQEGYIATPIR